MTAIYATAFVLTVLFAAIWVGTPWWRRTKRAALKLMQRRRWNWKKDGSLRHRLWALTGCPDPWWKWGHRLQIAVGQMSCGSWDEPEMETWWIHRGPTSRMWHTGFPRHKHPRIIRSYDEWRAIAATLNEDQLHDWHALYVDEDGCPEFGRRYWGEGFYGLEPWEVRITQRWLRTMRRRNWWGLRSWLWTLGLHNAVHAYKPRSCAVIPPPRSGGYSHWHCELPRRHDGMHRKGNYVWGDVGGEDLGRVVHLPRSGS